MARFVPILRVESPTLRLLIDVNAESRMGSTLPNGRVQVAGAPADIDYVSDTGEAGFGLWEQTDYRFTVEPKVVGQGVSFTTRSTTLLAGIGEIGGTGVRSGVLNFGSLVGVVAFELGTQRERLRISLEVFPSKVDYKVDYQNLLYAIDVHSSRLLFRFYQATHRLSGSAERPGEDDRDIDWLVILRSEIGQLMDGVRIIDQHPHEVLNRDVSYVRAHQIRRFGGTTITAIRQGRGKGSFVRVGGIAARERLPADTRIRSWDSPEHRWIHGQLALIASRVGRIRVAVQAETNAASADDSAVKVGILQELDQLEATIALALRTEPIRGARSDAGAISTPSTVLLSKSGYSEVFRSIIALRDILTLLGVTRESSISNVARLYEQWCFLEIVELVRSQFQGYDPADELRIISERLLAPTIIGGATVLSYDAEGVRVSVSNNKTLRTPTGDHKPDILISIDRAGRRPIKLVLDAKYRRYEPKHGSEHIGPGQDAINAMHRYRDAITVRDHDTNLRPVTHAVALFPASVDESEGYAQARLFASIATTGIGALPFLPGNLSYVRNWLHSILANPDSANIQAGFLTSREAEVSALEMLVSERMHLDARSARTAAKRGPHAPQGQGALPAGGRP